MDVAGAAASNENRADQIEVLVAEEEELIEEHILDILMV